VIGTLALRSVDAGYKVISLMNLNITLMHIFRFEKILFSSSLDQMKVYNYESTCKTSLCTASIVIYIIVLFSLITVLLLRSHIS